MLAWIDARAIETLYLSAVTVAERRFGIVTLPSGKRRDILHRRLEAQVLALFAHRVRPFDLDAATACAGLMVAIRDTSPFEAAGLRTIDPWDAVREPKAGRS
ncbi:hypothetical protein [Methylobacterium platani]|uniref:PIN domain-containing protein n=1 Tax=Methylobacterium platani TaxID=427683 RepID=A0A179SG86_9HYPH|nr:hypothetical protein [Methylobacterium platani]OAS25515.1 hypothetical protein A5481_09135 [Methylobacterium platani]